MGRLVYSGCVCRNGAPTARRCGRQARPKRTEKNFLHLDEQQQCLGLASGCGDRAVCAVYTRCAHVAGAGLCCPMGTPVHASAKRPRQKRHTRSGLSVSTHTRALPGRSRRGQRKIPTGATPWRPAGVLRSVWVGTSKTCFLPFCTFERRRILFKPFFFFPTRFED